MTKLPEPITHRRVLAIAVPIVLANVTVPLIGLVDTGVIGQLGEAAPIGAVGLGAVVLGGIYWFFGFLRMVTTGLAAQAEGAGDGIGLSAILWRALLTGLGAGVAVIVLQRWLFGGAFLLLDVSADVENLMRLYVEVRVWSAPAAIALFGMTGWLIARERTRSVLIVQAGSNLLNMGLDLWFVLGLGWGVGGVAAATVIAEMAGLAIGLWLCRDGLRGLGWARRRLIFEQRAVQQNAAVSRDVFLRSLFLQLIFLSFNFWSARFGDVRLASVQVLMQFLGFFAYALDGFAFAAESLVGQAVGRKDRAALVRSVRLGFLWGLVICAGGSVSLWLAGGVLIDLLTTAPDVREIARLYLPYLLFAPLLGLPCWMLDGVFIGATRGPDMRNMMAVATALYFIAAYPLMRAYGLDGLWVALLLSFVFRGVTLAARYPALLRSVGA